MADRAAKQEVLSALRRDLSRLESPQEARPALSLGEAALDRRLTGGCGLILGGLHEIVGSAYPDMGAVSGFAAALGARLMAQGSPPAKRALVWVVQGTGSHDLGLLYGPGLRMLGLDPRQLVLVRVRDDREALWVTEEALKTPDLAGVVAELGGGRAYDLKASRRLQLAAEKFGRPALLLAGHAAGASAALTRFRISSAASAANPLTPAAPGRLRFSVHLDRVRGGAPCHFLMEWMHETHRFAVAARLSRGADAAPRRQGAGGAAAAARPQAPARARPAKKLAV
ncbi:ImuA family protein [Pyruvatibacter mobilis]|uniref:ImuA family protein n=1 Tax=Pyruvatibacter mobilis TaxID=1712261 RepID=UPI003D0D12F7